MYTAIDVTMLMRKMKDSKIRAQPDEYSEVTFDLKRSVHQFGDKWGVEKKRKVHLGLMAEKGVGNHPEKSTHFQMGNPPENSTQFEIASQPEKSTHFVMEIHLKNKLIFRWEIKLKNQIILRL